MAQVRDALYRSTIFQLRAVVSAVRQRDFGLAASKLGIRDKHRLIRAVERLAENLGVTDLVSRLESDPDEYERLADAADEVLKALDDFESAAADYGSRQHSVRCQAYPSMVRIFLADAAHEFEQATARTHPNSPSALIHFIELESSNRRRGGSGALRQLASGLADIAIAPTALTELEETNSRWLYSWRIVAAVHPLHPLRDQAVELEDGTAGVMIDDTCKFPVLVSPLTHRSRTMLDFHQPAEGFDVELETSNTEARVALGSAGDRVPLVASDAIPDHEFDPSWPAVLVRNEDSITPLAHSHRIWWRANASKSQQNYIEQFVEFADTAAGRLRDRPGGAMESS